MGLGLSRSKWLSRSLSILLIFQSLTVNAQSVPPIPHHQPEFPGQKFEGLGHFPNLNEADEKAWSEFLNQEVKNRDKTNIEKVTDTGDQLVDLMIAYKNFFAENLNLIEDDIQKNGSESFRKKLEANEVFFENPELGKMEFTTVDDEPVAKIVHKKSGVAFIIYDEESTDRNSSHFKKLIARQHYDAGSTRPQNKYFDENGKKRRIKYGRDVLIMGVRGFEIAEGTVEAAPRQRGLKHWWRATFKKPTKKDVVLGFVSGLAQFFSVGALAEFVAWVLPGYERGHTPELIATFTLAYGSLFGIWNSFYQNWRSRGPKHVRDLKNLTVSLSYYFGVYVISHIGMQQLTIHDFSVDPSTLVNFVDSLRHLSVDQVTNYISSKAQTIGNLSLLAGAAAIHPFSNFWANNEFKNVGYWLQRVSEIERTDLHNVSVMIPKGIKKDEVTGKWGLDYWKIETPMGRRYWNRQFLYYLPVNWAKFLDQVWFGWTIGAAMSGEYPAWMPFVSVAAYWTLVHSSIRGINWWAYKNHKAAAEQLKIREESWYYFGSSILQRSGAFLNRQLLGIKKMFGNQVGQPNELFPDSMKQDSKKSKCQELLAPESEAVSDLDDSKLAG